MIVPIDIDHYVFIEKFIYRSKVPEYLKNDIPYQCNICIETLPNKI